jgi:hypothetical protein
LVDGYTAPDIARLKTDVFRDRAHYAVEARKQLATPAAPARTHSEVAGTLGEVQDLESGVVIDLFLSYRALSDWQAMVDLVADAGAAGAQRAGPGATRLCPQSSQASRRSRTAAGAS